MECFLNTGMGRTLFPVSVAAILLAACSPAAYKVNPPPVAVEESSPVRNAEGTSSTTWRDELNEPVVEGEPEIVKRTPESQEDGYMRIIGDLRWDQLTSKEEWKKRVPGCLQTFGHPNILVWKSSSDSDFCQKLIIGGSTIGPSWIRFSGTSGTQSGTMTTEVRFAFLDDSQGRAIKAALSQKYNYTTNGYCSKYTCWDFLDHFRVTIEATPTPYTISLLDQVQVNMSDL